MQPNSQQETVRDPHRAAPRAARGRQLEGRHPTRRLRADGAAAAMSRLTDPAWAADPVWQEHQTALRGWPGRPSILELCAGAGTGGVALELLLGPDAWQNSGAYDRDAELRSVFAVLHGEPEHSRRIHCGPSGDIMNMEPGSFPSANIVVAGPPCPPYSSIGQRAGLADDRARPFVKCIDIICNLAERPASTGTRLWFFLLENVMGVRFRTRGAEGSPLDAMQELLRARLGGEWAMQRVFAKAADFGLPQSRPRVYLVGRRMAMYPRGAPPPV